MGNGKDQTTDLAIQESAEIMTLESPLVVIDGRGNDIAISRQQFMSYYAKGATQEELFHCYQQTRATGLNPMVPGQCYYFRTGDRPMSLFTGYPVYLQKAKAAGLEHYSAELDDDTKPTVCTVTLQIKERPEFVWRTWFDEVASTTRDGELNARWKKAPRQMFIKCSVVNAIRMSMLFDLTMPYIVEEAGELVAPGFRTLTPEQLGAYEPESEEATIGEVTAADHQVDTSAFRKKYFRTLKEMGIVMEDEQRREWQKEHFDMESVSGATPDEWIEIFEKLAVMRVEMGATKEPDSFIDAAQDIVAEVSPDARGSEVKPPPMTLEQIVPVLSTRLDTSMNEFDRFRKATWDKAKEAKTVLSAAVTGEAVFETVKGLYEDWKEGAEKEPEKESEEVEMDLLEAGGGTQMEGESDA